MLSSKVQALPQRPARNGDAPSALAGVRVVDFTHFIAGPLGTMMLADLGADVVKIESPVRGDEFRYYPPIDPEAPRQGAPYVWCNRNKRSVALDLKTPAGVALARELVAGADVVVENFSSSVMQRLGLDYASCAEANPRLVYCSISAYGREGPFSDRLGFDPIAQAESGFLAMNGYPDREGVRTLSPVVDVHSGAMVTNGVLAALLAREKTGRGQWLEVTLFNSSVQLAGFASMQYFFTGRSPTRWGNTSPDSSPSGVFRCRDAAFYFNCGNDRIFRRLMADVLERPDLAADPVLATREGRIERRQELFEVLEAAFAEHDWAYWAPRMRAASLPCGLVRDLGTALTSAEAQSQNLVSRIPHPVFGWVPNIELPVRLTGTPVIEPTAAPELGEHTREVLGQLLGLGDEEIERLAREGAFGSS